MDEKKERIEQAMQQMYEEGLGWFETMDFDTLCDFTKQLTSMTEQAATQLGEEVDTEIIDKSEELILEISRYIETVLQEEEAMHALLGQAKQLQKTIQFSSNDRLQFENTSILEKTVAAIENFLDEFDIDYGIGNPEDVQVDRNSPAGRSDRGVDAVAMLQSRETLLKCISVVRKGPSYFGVTRAEIQRGAPVVSVLPLQGILGKFERERQDGSLDLDSDLDVLADFARRILRFGYPSVAKAFDSMHLKPEQEKEEVTLQSFQTRLSLLGVQCEGITTRLFELFEPFCIGNFRRLLSSKIVNEELLKDASGGTRIAAKKLPTATSPEIPESEPSTYEPSTPASTRTGTPSMTSGLNSRPSSSYPPGRGSQLAGGMSRPQSSNPRGSSGQNSIPEVAQKQRPRTAVPGSRR
jgi:hypothetical protein